MFRAFQIFSFAFSLLVTSGISGAQTRPATLPSRAARVLIISIDGLRPDVLLRADAPTIRSLMQRGSSSMWAKTTDLAITMPSHVSMLTGVKPETHGITTNLPGDPILFPKVPTLFEIAHRAGFSTAMVAGKLKFVILAKPGTLDWNYITPLDKTDDADVAAHAVAIVREHAPQVIFVHLAGVDTAGHAKGWGTPEQIDAIAEADHAIAHILAALDEKHLRDETLIIITADHGGAGRTHGKNDDRSANIPWIASGPGVKKNFDLTLYGDFTIHTEDTFATAATALGLTVDHPIDGKSIGEIYENFNRGELLVERAHPTTTPSPAANGRTNLAHP